MAKLSNLTPKTPTAGACQAPDDTLSIRAFLARTRPLSGCDFGSADGFHNGRGLVEELALSIESGTTLRWSLDQCADVLRFVHAVEPTKGNCFCADKSEVSATCGLHAILEFVEKRLRRETKKSKETGHGR
jgi:hypothetical protein